MKSFCQTFFKKFGGIVKGATLDTGFLRAVALKLPKIKTNQTEIFHLVFFFQSIEKAYLFFCGEYTDCFQLIFRQTCLIHFHLTLKLESL